MTPEIIKAVADELKKIPVRDGGYTDLEDVARHCIQAYEHHAWRPLEAQGIAITHASLGTIFVIGENSALKVRQLIDASSPYKSAQRTVRIVNQDGRWCSDLLPAPGESQ